MIDDPLPDCQDDCIEPIWVKNRLKVLKPPAAKEFEASLDEAQSAGYKESNIDNIVRFVRKRKRGWNCSKHRRSDLLILGHCENIEIVTAKQFCEKYSEK